MSVRIIKCYHDKYANKIIFCIEKIHPDGTFVEMEGRYKPLYWVKDHWEEISITNFPKEFHNHPEVHQAIADMKNYTASLPKETMEEYKKFFQDKALKDLLAGPKLTQEDVEKLLKALV